MTTTLYDTSRGIVEYTYLGSGPAILLLKGGHSTRNTDLSHNSLVYEGYSLLTISRPGYDYTEVSTGRTPEEFAKTIIEVLDHLSIAKAAVIAIAGAGPTGLALASAYPSRVTKLVMEAACISSGKDGGQRGKWLFSTADRVVWVSIKAMLKFFPEIIMKQKLTELTTENADEFFERLSPNDRHFVYNMLATSQSRKEYKEDSNSSILDLEKVHVPVLGMYSSKDKTVEFSNALLLKSHAPNCELYEVNADSHLIWIGKDARQVWEKRLQFLSH
ncbi:alpha/beta fold hydrolase [Halobacillus salinarum]|uniref:Alpha/beta fold hydrolase n=1 Tax=Halobacillus salinarum TaxID=2932257 RepID=A0ABY4EI43_9BACI|nr:alpha/beta fold hydrolase [Halobacillus salinarum]UOQ43548.1 alpha/beta fold hydrolase [Halobacillus salinarum]